uniref:Uncharacterized protein n=1 Tax=Arundo donax TaxID=35708 RepID=A0A0A9A4M5_ARUDO
MHGQNSYYVSLHCIVNLLFSPDDYELLLYC